VLLVNSLQCGKVWQACAQQTEKRHWYTNSFTPLVHKQFHVKFMHVPCQFNIYVVYFFNISFGVVQHQKQLVCREGRKKLFKYTNFTELKI